MVLESLEQGPNIKDLSVEEAEAKLPNIDPERDIDWEATFKRTMRDYEESQYDALITDLEAIHSINPDKLEQLDLPTKLNVLKHQLVWLRSSCEFDRVWQDILRIASCLKVLNPNLILKEILSERMYQRIANNIDGQNISDGVGFSENAARLRILFPNHGVTLSLEAKRPEFLKCVRESHSSDFWYFARNYLVAYAGSEKPPSDDIVISKEQWVEMIKDFEQYRRRIRYMILPVDHAALLKVLRAKEVKVTEKGVELIGDRFEEDQINDIPPPLPEQRSF